jgi:hypothetical protein
MLYRPLVIVTGHWGARFVSLQVACLFFGLGGALSKMSIASSKLSGWSEIGLAFGMRPPMVKTSAHSWADTSCWHASAATSSAFCYHIVEYSRILAVIVAIRELRQVQRQIVLAHLVIGTNYAPLQQAPKAIQVGGWTFPRTYPPLAWLTDW